MITRAAARRMFSGAARGGREEGEGVENDDNVGSRFEERVFDPNRAVDLSKLLSGYEAMGIDRRIRARRIALLALPAIALAALLVREIAGEWARVATIATISNAAVLLVLTTLLWRWVDRPHLSKRTRLLMRAPAGALKRLHDDSVRAEHRGKLVEGKPGRLIEERRARANVSRLGENGAEHLVDIEPHGGEVDDLSADAACEGDVASIQVRGDDQGLARKAGDADLLRVVSVGHGGERTAPCAPGSNVGGHTAPLDPGAEGALAASVVSAEFNGYRVTYDVDPDAHPDGIWFTADGDSDGRVSGFLTPQLARALAAELTAAADRYEAERATQ